MHSLLQRLHDFHPTFHEQIFLSTFLLRLPKYYLCLRLSVFHLTFNLSEFQLTPQTLYHHYLHVANSHLVSEHKLIPHTGNSLQAAYAHHCLTTRKGSTNTAFLTAMFAGVHSTTNTMLVTRGLYLHNVSTEIDGSVNFAMGHYSSPHNARWMVSGSKTQETGYFTPKLILHILLFHQ